MSNSVLWATGQAFLKNLQELDLEAIAYQLAQLGWSHQQTSHAIRHYRMFLFLVYLYPNTRLIPTQEVDRVWHCHILHTRKYRQDCQMLFGRFIDHEPDLQQVHPIGLHSSFVVRERCPPVEVREQDAHTTIAKLRCTHSQPCGQANPFSLDSAFLHTQALLEHYFGQAALGNILLAQVDSLELAECSPQRHSDRKQVFFPHHRSACGRPGFEECDRSSVAFV